MDQTITINSFDLNSFVKHPTIIISAKRGSGKSVLIKHLISHFITSEHIPVGVICSASEAAEPYFQNFFPDSFIYDRCSDELFTRILRRQKKLIADNKKRAENGEQVKDERILVVLDDVISDAKSWKNSNSLNDIMFNGRHYGITLILSTQDVVAVGPAVRNNFDYVFLFANDTRLEIEKIWRMYAGIFPTVKLFNDVLNVATANYGTLVIIKRGAKSNELSDKIARFKANINIKPPMFGCNKFKEIHKKKYNADWQDDFNVGNKGTSKIKFK